MITNPYPLKKWCRHVWEKYIRHGGWWHCGKCGGDYQVKKSSTPVPEVGGRTD